MLCWCVELCRKIKSSAISDSQVRYVLSMIFLPRSGLMMGHLLLISSICEFCPCYKQIWEEHVPCWSRPLFPSGSGFSSLAAFVCSSKITIMDVVGLNFPKITCGICCPPMVVASPACGHLI